MKWKNPVEDSGSSLSTTYIYCHGILPVGPNKITKIPRYASRTPERILKHEIHTYDAELDHDILMYWVTIKEIDTFNVVVKRNYY